MRRAQVECGDQPVRNLFINPDMERQSGTTVVRQNLTPWASFESQSPTVSVRKNLMGNPRGKTVMTQYATVGVQVITGNVAITGHPEGITTANRFTYGGTTPSNPGIQFFNGTPGTNYTLSAWIYIESLCTTPGTTGWAESGILAGPNFANTVGVWQKVTWNRTPTSGNGIGIRTAAADGGSASILITGVVIEQLPQAVASSTFFDGDTAASGDFTYAWQDTPGSGISVQRAPGVAGWAGSSTATTYQSSTTFLGGSKGGAVLTRGAAGDGIYHGSITASVGLPYTVSAWVRIDATLPQFSITMRWVDGAAVIIRDDTVNVYANLVVGQWARVSATFTAPANTSVLQPMFRIYAAHTSTVFYIDNVLVEQGSFLSSYFDGSYAAVGDFIYAWQGTAHGSISEERAPSVAGYSGFYSGGRIAWSSSVWSAGGSRSLAIASPRPTVDSFSQVAPLPSIIGDMGGKTYTFLANLKTLEAFPAGADGRAWSININVNLSGGGQFQYNIKPTTTFAGVHEIRQAIKIRDDATSLVYMRLYNGSPNPSTVYWDNVMMVEGDYTGDYVDGNKPFSKWDGTTQASTSVGYPQHLRDIAGKPDIDVLGIGSLSNTGVADPFMARTFYVVYENTGNANNYNVCASYGVIGSQGYMCQTAGSGSNSMAHRVDMPGGTFNGGLVFGNARTSKRHVVAITANQGLTNMTGCTDGGSDVGQNTTPGSGWSDNRVLTAATAEIKPVRFLVFNAAHDRATRLALSRYLGNKYGAPVA